MEEALDDNPGYIANIRLLFEQASAELAATYAALILADDGIEITVCPWQVPLHSKSLTQFLSLTKFWL